MTTNQRESKKLTNMDIYYLAKDVVVAPNVREIRMRLDLGCWSKASNAQTWCAELNQNLLPDEEPYYVLASPVLE